MTPFFVALHLLGDIWDCCLHHSCVHSQSQPLLCCVLYRKYCVVSGRGAIWQCNCECRIATGWCMDRTTGSSLCRTPPSHVLLGCNVILLVHTLRYIFFVSDTQIVWTDRGALLMKANCWCFKQSVFAPCPNHFEVTISSRTFRDSGSALAVEVAYVADRICWQR